MQTDHRDQLKSIRTFPSLVRYLRDELDWPISSEDFEELTFDYSPEELGIDTANAAKIQEIKRLRPLSVNQPWGIFFVKFEPKRLPVVALRRILSRVVVKKRASANVAERAAWQVDDLLFVSNYGEGEERRISFAHFAQDAEKNDLPTLKVLGWDNLDTALHLDHVADMLNERLVWPNDEEDIDRWRESWRSAFTLRHREVVTTSKALAIRLAELARAIRDRIKTALAIETETGPLTKLMKAFQEALVHDLDPGGFADMYAQTIAYGLLSVRIADPEKKTADDFAAHMRTNPFLKELMETFLHIGGRHGKAGGPGIDFDELGVSEVVDLLDDANMEAVVLDFGDRNPQEDPVIHFYELFLKEYDAKKKMKRGVFYTPQPVVSFIVRSVDELLRTEFGLEDGLADTTTWGEMVGRHEGLEVPDGAEPGDTFVQILDPATGTGTFLVEVIDLIYRTMSEKWEGEGHGGKMIGNLWNDYVPKHLLPRLHGYELLMAPYAIAHMKIGLKLYETGYRFGSDKRARVYLTNALEPAQDFSGTLAFAIPALAHEAEAVNTIKRNQRFTVVIGNPPYSDASQNLGTQFSTLIERFRHFQGERIREPGAIRFEHAINNDYVKFWGLSLGVLSAVPVGTVCLITSNSFLEGKSFRGVRDGIIEACEEVQVTDLHGEGWSGPLAQAGIEDDNVFEIQTGVAITQLAKLLVRKPEPRVKYGDLIGPYATKISTLSNDDNSIDHTDVILNARKYLSFIPSKTGSYGEYWNYHQLDSFFLTSVDGIKTSRDGLVIGNSSEECRDKILRFAAMIEADVQEIEEEFHFKANRFNVRDAQKHVRDTFDELRLHPIAYRPFDVRYIYYDRELILSHRLNVMPCMLDRHSRAIVCASRLSSKGFDHVVAASTLCAHKYASHDINSRMFPVVGLFDGLMERELRSNVREDILNQSHVRSDVSEVERALIFGRYVYAVTNAPSYRSRYFEDISQDFPRIPLPRNPHVVTSLTELGLQLERAHCLDVVVPEKEFMFCGSIGEKIRSPRWRQGALWIGQSSFFDGVDSEIWEFRMAGYQVCKSWFSAGNRSGLQRKGTPISDAVASQFRTVLWAIKETLRVREMIDEVIDQHGGWPDAFQSAADQPSPPASPTSRP